MPVLSAIANISRRCISLQGFKHCEKLCIPPAGYDEQGPERSVRILRDWDHHGASQSIRRMMVRGGE